MNMIKGHNSNAYIECAFEPIGYDFRISVRRCSMPKRDKMICDEKVIESDGSLSELSIRLREYILEKAKIKPFHVGPCYLKEEDEFENARYILYRCDASPKDMGRRMENTRLVLMSVIESFAKSYTDDKCRESA